jgi:L,D-transpeptidase YbiS
VVMVEVEYPTGAVFLVTLPEEVSLKTALPDVRVEHLPPDAQRRLAKEERALLSRYGWAARVEGRPALWVSVDEQRCRLVRDGYVLRQWHCSTAAKGTGAEMNSLKTPLGWHQVREKIGAGTPWGTVFKSKEAGKAWAPGQDTKDDLVLTRLVSLTGLEPGRNKGGKQDSFARSIYLHGTNDEDKIGVPASHGCVRLYNDDVVELFDLVDTSTLVLLTEEGEAPPAPPENMSAKLEPAQ